jgi:protein-tyrosine kinase
MSRIEKALEKALDLRGLQRPEYREEPVAVQEPAARHRFEVPPTTLLDKKLVDKHIVCITEPNSPVAEQYKRLRARVLMATKEAFHNTIMVTSSNPGEGKSVTALNLAVAIAGAYDHTVLLVDADLRNPSICRYLGLTPKYGLGDCLAGKVDISDAIIKTGIGKLAVLPAGKPSEHSAEALSSEKMKRLVTEMKDRYKDRYIIFDSSPLLVTADPLSLGKYVDGILLVVQADNTSEKTVSQAVALLRDYNILGVVLNNMPQRLATANYPYYNQYYKRREIEK